MTLMVICAAASISRWRRPTSRRRREIVAARMPSESQRKTELSTSGMTVPNDVSKLRSVSGRKACSRMWDRCSSCSSSCASVSVMPPKTASRPKTAALARSLRPKIMRLSSAVDRSVGTILLKDDRRDGGAEASGVISLRYWRSLSIVLRSVGPSCVAVARPSEWRPAVCRAVNCRPVAPMTTSWAGCGSGAVARAAWWWSSMPS